MGAFGIVRDSAGNPMGGMTIVVYGSSAPSVTSRNSLSGAARDRNYEVNIFQAGNYAIGIEDGNGVVLSARVPITVNFFDQCDVKEGQAGSQWVETDFRAN
jgi:hypothetical protein